MKDVRNLIFNLDTPYRNVHCLIKTDSDNNIVHVLDFYGTTAVTTNIKLIQERIAEELVLAGTIHDWKWYLYSTDATVLEYESSRTCNGNGFRFLADHESDHQFLDKDFFNKMQSLSELYWQRIVIV